MIYVIGIAQSYKIKYDVKDEREFRVSEIIEELKSDYGVKEIYTQKNDEEPQLVYTREKCAKSVVYDDDWD